MYAIKKDTNGSQVIITDDMILTTDCPTTAGSKMLDGYKSLIEAQVLADLKAAGYQLGGKAQVGEFAIDLLGETSYTGAEVKDGHIINPSAEILKQGEAVAAINLDVNGSVRRAAAQNDLVSIKPTYGTVSRYGTIPVVCSGETVSVMASDVKTCKDVLGAIVKHDDKDGTSLPEEKCNLVKTFSAEVKKVAVLNPFLTKIQDDVKAKVDAFCAKLEANDIIVSRIEDDIIIKSNIAWNILMCAELCNNVSRYDGVKYGYRTQNFTNIDELYTNSRTEAFGELLKTAILYGSETLSTDNYFKVYDKALRVRRVICQEFNKLFEEYDAVIIPACSQMTYTEELVKSNKHITFDENLYTAPASITGLPALVVDGIQVIGKAFSENVLFDIAGVCAKEGR